MMAERSPAEESADLRRKLDSEISLAKQMAIDFAVRHKFIQFEKFETGSSIPDENIRITYCFGRYFEKQDKPETITADSGKTYVYNM